MAKTSDMNIKPKSSNVLNGDQALAWGALAGGIKMVTSYPGSPSSNTVEILVGLAKKHDLYVEWSSNERVALELAIGASIAGRRALVCTKSVGLNVMIDPLMALNLTPINGGLVLLLGDDPGGYGSQNDQDSRALAPLLEMPMLEPASPGEAYTMMRDAFVDSEKYHIPVIIRVTRSFTQQKESMFIPDGASEIIEHGLVREPHRFVPVPKNVVQKHRALHQTLKSLSEWAHSTTYNPVQGVGEHGIIAAGFAYQKLMDLFAGTLPQEVRLLKLGNLYPLPAQVISDFLLSCHEVLVLEENEPVLEIGIMALAQVSGCDVRIFGKQSGHVSQGGELFRWQIQKALKQFLPSLLPARAYLEQDEADEMPSKESYCADCRYDEVLDHLDKAALSLGQKPILVGDPGCLVTVSHRIDAKYAIGSAIGVASGMEKAGAPERAVALFGDSAFFHTAIPALCNAVHNCSNMVMVVLDNRSAITSGNQPTLGVSRDVLGNEVPALDIEKITRACGVKNVYPVNLDDTDPSLTQTFAKALGNDELNMVIVRILK